MSLFQHYELLRQSNLFDAAFYLSQNPDVADAGMDPLAHYIEFGYREGRAPSEDFDVAYYFAQCGALGQGVDNPLIHYLFVGRKCGLKMRPDEAIESDEELPDQDLDEAPVEEQVEIEPEASAETSDDAARRVVGDHFDRDYYLNRYKDVHKAGVDPLEHFLHTGWREGRNPAADFDTNHYLAENADVRGEDINPFFHYLVAGKAEGRSPMAVQTAAASSAPQEQEPSAEDRAHIRNAVAQHFDAEFYLERYGDVRAAKVNPLDHYLNAGWREGRDPCWEFDTSYYLDTYPDIRDAGVNPFFHFIVAGRTEGRKARDELAVEISVLKGSMTTREKSVFWMRDSLPKPTAMAELDRQLTRRLLKNPAGNCLAVSHDNYLDIVGGVQNCLTDEQRVFNELRVNYFQIFPVQALPRLSDETTTDRLLMGLTLNGKYVGAAHLSVVSKLLARKFQGPYKAGTLPARRFLVLHSLLGHSPEALVALASALKIEKSYFWLHDYFSLCENFTLQRSDLSFCGAPSRGSQACRICAYGCERATHQERVNRMFGKLKPAVLAPSEAALAVWKNGHSRPESVEEIVVAHCKIVVRPGKQAKRTHAQAGSEPVRIGFLGFDKYHKGWATFERLAEQFSSDKRYAFHHLGKRHGRVPFIHYTPVNVGREDRNAMISAAHKQGLDAVLVWPAWPETFSFVAFEAAAAGALVITNPRSGNVAAMVKQLSAGLILNDEEALHDLLRSDELKKMCTVRRKKGRTAPSLLAYSGCAAALFKPAAESVK